MKGHLVGITRRIHVLAIRKHLAVRYDRIVATVPCFTHTVLELVVDLCVSTSTVYFKDLLLLTIAPLVVSRLGDYSESGVDVRETSWIQMAVHRILLIQATVVDPAISLIMRVSSLVL